jgi:hypothetical protein
VSDRQLKAAAVVFFGVWASATALGWLIGSLMSLDEEWTGWGDVVLNPFLMAPYFTFTTVTGVICVKAIRRAWSNRRSLPRRRGAAHT